MSAGTTRRCRRRRHRAHRGPGEACTRRRGAWRRTASGGRRPPRARAARRGPGPPRHRGGQQHRGARSRMARPRPSGRGAGGVERDGGERAVEGGEHGAAGQASDRGGRQVAVATPSGSPNRSSSRRCGVSGVSASSAPRPTSPVTATAVALGPDARVARRDDDQHGRDRDARRPRPTERRAGQRGEHEAREQPVGERLGARSASRSTTTQKPSAPQTEPEQRHLEQRAPVDAGAQRVTVVASSRSRSLVRVISDGRAGRVTAPAGS